jgi:hypothetical protein
MRRTKRLKALSDAFGDRLDRLASLVQPLAGLDGPRVNRLVSYVVIDSVGSWALFAREYYLSCALLGPRLRSKARVTYGLAPIAGERDAIIQAIRATKNPSFAPAASVKIKPRDEPDWLAKNTLSKISTVLSFSHDARITAALSQPTTFFSQAITVRNFFAHRSKESADKIRTLSLHQYLYPHLRHPTEFVNGILPSRTDTILNEWLADLKDISRALC